MHPDQDAFYQGIAASDVRSASDALMRIAGALAQTKLSRETRRQLRWTCRHFLTSLAERYSIGAMVEIKEASFTLCLNSRFGPDRSVPKVCVHPGYRDPATVLSRWRALGFTNKPQPIKEPVVLPGGALSFDIPRHVQKIRPDQTYAAALDAPSPSYSPSFQRYQSGECVPVWAELLALGAGVRTPEVFPEAVAVARETMRRCRYNVELLAGRLRERGYDFVEPDKAYEPPIADVLDQIAALEQHVGPLPISLCAWYEVVGSVDFRGTLSDWPSSQDAPDDTSLPPDGRFAKNPSRCGLPDPLVVHSGSWLLDFKKDYWQERKYQLQFAPDDYHKADISGGPPHTMTAPNAAIDGRVEFEWHDTEFVPYLREVFRWSGFPGLARYWRSPDVQKTIDELGEGLIPI